MTVLRVTDVREPRPPKAKRSWNRSAVRRWGAGERSSVEDIEGIETALLSSAQDAREDLLGVGAPPLAIAHCGVMTAGAQRLPGRQLVALARRGRPATDSSRCARATSTP